MRLLNRVSLTTLSLNWQLFLLVAFGIFMLAGSLLLARASVNLSFSTAVPVPDVVHLAESAKEAAGHEDFLQRLFHPAEGADDPYPQEDERMSSDDERLFNAPASTLPVQITGIISSSLPQRSLLIIQSNGGQLSLSPGERLPASNAELIRIFPDRAIIYHNGKYASLKMAD